MAREIFVLGRTTTLEKAYFFVEKMLSTNVNFSVLEKFMVKKIAKNIKQRKILCNVFPTREQNNTSKF